MSFCSALTDVLILEVWTSVVPGQFEGHESEGLQRFLFFEYYIIKYDLNSKGLWYTLTGA